MEVGETVVLVGDVDGMPAGKEGFFCNFRVKFMRLTKQGSPGSTGNSAALRAGRGDRLLRWSAVRSFLAASSQTQNESV